MSFPTARSQDALEQGTSFSPRFDADGLIAAVATHAETGEVLMLAWMNEEALQKTLESGEAYYYSRSRKELWHKGATSGLVQLVRELLIDDDQDCVWLRVSVAGGASCHVGYRSCFYRRVPLGEQDDAERALVFTETKKLFDPDEVYGDVPEDLYVILDAKRGDIGSTAERYAAGLLGHLEADAVTLSPYLGQDAIEPFLAFPDRCVYVLARTSNPSAAMSCSRISEPWRS